MESHETLLTQEFAKKLKSQLKKVNGVRLPRRKYTPRRPRLYMNALMSTIKPRDPNEELEEGEISRETPLRRIMAQISTIDQQPSHFQTNPDASDLILVKEEITVTPDVDLLSETVTADNQISLKKIRANSFPCPLCPMEATQGHIRFHLHSTHGETLRNINQLHECLICKKDVASGDIISHSLTHTHDMGFDCNFCDERFFYKIRLDQHLERVHETFSCEFCEKTYFSRKEWKSHNMTKLHKMKKFAQQELMKQGIKV